MLTLSSVGAGVTVLLAVLSPAAAGGWLSTLLVVVPVLAVLMTGAWRLTRSTRTRPLLWAIFPIATVVVVVALDLATADTSTAAQVFLFFPALYGASQLPRAAAILMTAVAVAGDALIVFAMEPLRAATIDLVYIAAAIVTCSALLVYSGERRAALLAVVQRQAVIDPLTGLATRRALDQAAMMLLSNASSGTGIGLVLIDIDHFKSINDGHGHPAGDEVLIRLGQLLREHAAPEDIVSRMGGDETALLLPAVTAEQARAHAERVCHSVRSTPFYAADDVRIDVTVSVGVAHAPTHGGNLRALYVAADLALYEAKRKGRNRVGAASDLPPQPATGSTR